MPYTSLHLRTFVALALLVAAPCAAQEVHGAFPVADSAAVTALRPSRATDVFILEPARAIGTALVALLVRVPTNSRLAPSLHACTVTGSEPAHAACTVLPTPSVESPSTVPYNVDSIAADDVDSDGEPEFRVAISYQGAWVRPGVGSDFRYLYVVDLVPSARVALALETHRYTMISDRAVDRTVTFRDLNGDGHPDAVVEENACSDSTAEPPAESHCRRDTRQYLWNRVSDSWTAASVRR